MQEKTHMHNKTKFRSLACCAVSLIAYGITGCSVNPQASSAVRSPTSNRTFTGNLHGGQQPVSGSSIQLYAASATGYGSAATPLLTTAVFTDANGNFSVTGDYTCPANSFVYLTATGGNPGLGPNFTNPNLGLMAALGLCSSLTPATFVHVNELTTVASVWPLAHFMHGFAGLGTTPGNQAGLIAAFAAVNKVVNLAAGITPGPGLPAGATLPTSEINTLAAILASCINSAGGIAGDGSICGKLFMATTPVGGTPPTDTITAAVNIAQNPGSNIATLFSLVSPISPFQPVLASAPDNFLIGINYVGGGLNAPQAIAVDAAGNIWAANSGNASLTELTNNGLAISPVAGFTGGGLNTPTALAFDLPGNLWITNTAGNSVSKFTSTGTPVAGSPYVGGGLSAPSGVSVDPVGNIWIANSANSSLTELSGTGAALSPITGFLGAGISTPVSIAISPR